MQAYEIDNSDPTPPSEERGVEDSNAPKTWQKGGPSPNPHGRPKVPKTPREVKELAKQYTVVAVETLAKVCKNPKSPPAARVAASEALLARAWGRPSGDFEGGEQLVIKVVKFANEQLEENNIKTIEGTINEEGN